MRMEQYEDDPTHRIGHCEVCNAPIERWRGEAGDLVCVEQNQSTCPAIYNLFGQRLRDDLYVNVNYSEYDDDIGDMEGYEQAMNRYEHSLNDYHEEEDEAP